MRIDDFSFWKDYEENGYSAPRVAGNLRVEKKGPEYAL